MNPYSLEDKAIVVFGASSGIGKATAKFLSTLGARVILAGRNEGRLQQTLNEMDNTKHHLIKTLDLQNENQVKTWLKELVADFGAKLDGMVYSAGVHHFTPLRSINQEYLDEMWNVNVKSLISLLGSFSNRNISNDGSSVVLLSSISSIVGEKAVMGYSAAKGAINSIVKSAAVELSQRKIRVNSILPGMVETEMSKHIQLSLSEEQFTQVKDKHLLGMGNPDDIAFSIGYLLAPASRWVTGTNVVIDGGYSL
ncbi:SDR family NAD(P)-dependent oxidoreductase [Cohnella panacarvi]|uniref:SDR family NAD(P)-dependent oxidoreductase n=1 Tax=Cohnella panacarvi TaxID=400776 RepID=UPI000479ECC1|nr:SDR family oxidoreductase [Cohnella panacarvi]